MKIRKWKSPMTVGNEKLFKSRRRRTKGQGWAQGSATAGQSISRNGQLKCSEIFQFPKPFLNMQNNGKGRNPFSFLCCILRKSKSLQFKRVFVCVAINCEYLQPSPPGRGAVTLFPHRGNPYVNPGLLEPGTASYAWPRIDAISVTHSQFSH